MTVDPSASSAQQRQRSRASSLSGRLLLRMPPALHGEIARAAEEAGVSLNGFINQCLGEKVGWLHGENGHKGTHTPPPDSTLMRLLVVNVVAIAAAAAAAVAILLVVWLG